ncbi:MAG TPA: glycosyltransferase [Flavobacteriaceae bacterium]|nr:glycosyltransferase [Flavobacteriaceae bacterium]
MHKILIIGQVWPEPTSSAAGSRMLQLVEVFLENEFEITFASTAAQNEFSAGLQNLGVKTQPIRLNHKSFDEFLKQENPNIVLFDRFMVEEQFGWRVSENCPKAVRVLDTEDLHFLRKARQKAFEENRNFKKTDLFSEIAKREIASILRCDLSLIISEAEMEILTETFKIDKNLLCYLPFLLDPMMQTDLKNLPGFEERKHFVSIGNFLHPPNLDMVLWLKKEIWPLIRKKLPDAELHIYGAYASQKATNLNDPNDGFFIKGRANDSKTVLKNAKILLAPLRFGAGLKGKFVEAMLCGTPCVSTTIGAEGIGGGLPWNGEIANSPREIAEAAIRLYQNKKRWKKSQGFGMEIINQRFQKNQFSEKLIHTLKMLLENLEQHRQQNFLGAMLLHHSMQSTKYLARWIEEKNKLL